MVIDVGPDEPLLFVFQVVTKSVLLNTVTFVSGPQLFHSFDSSMTPGTSAQARM